VCANSNNFSILFYVSVLPFPYLSLFKNKMGFSRLEITIAALSFICLVIYEKLKSFAYVLGLLDFVQNCFIMGAALQDHSVDLLKPA
jgi:hypothetical protein